MQNKSKLMHRNKNLSVSSKKTVSKLPILRNNKSDKDDSESSSEKSDY